MPTFIKEESSFRYINDEDNAVMVEAAFSQNHFFTGKGAGGYPVGSAILSDVSAYSYHYQYAYKKKEFSNLSVSEDVEFFDIGKTIPKAGLETDPYRGLEGRRYSHSQKPDPEGYVPDLPGALPVLLLHTLVLVPAHLRRPTHR